jgi:hypothetical protein
MNWLRTGAELPRLAAGAIARPLLCTDSIQFNYWLTCLLYVVHITVFTFQPHSCILSGIFPICVNSPFSYRLVTVYRVESSLMYLYLLNWFSFFPVARYSSLLSIFLMKCYKLWSHLFPCIFYSNVDFLYVLLNFLHSSYIQALQSSLCSLIWKPFLFSLSCF